MVSVTVEAKTYELKRRMTRYEMELVTKQVSKYADLEKLAASNPEEAEKVIMSTTPEESALVDEIVANCTGIDKEKVYKEMEFVHEALLFAAILEVSVPRKNSASPSEKPTTATTFTPLQE